MRFQAFFLYGEDGLPSMVSFVVRLGTTLLVPLSREPSAHGDQPLLVPLCPNLSSPQLLPHGGLAQTHRGHQLASPFDSNTKLPVPI